MNLRDLHYLVAVAEHGHFGRAAEACHVSQPALSMQLKKLEEELGVQLFERSRKQVRTTKAGREILVRAKQVLQGAEEIRRIAAASQDPFAGEVTLGAFPTLAPYFFPLILPALGRALPKLTFLLVEEKTEQLLAMLKKGELDAAFLALPVPEEGLSVFPLWEDPFVLAVGKSHRLASCAQVMAADMAGEDLLLLEEGHCLRDQALSFCHRMGTGERRDFRATSLETLRQMVASGVGITLMPQIARREGDGLTYIPFAGQPPSRRIALLWRRSSTRAACFSRIADIAQGAVE